MVQKTINEAKEKSSVLSLLYSDLGMAGYNVDKGV